jgi:three-Cys-motif partner protein
VLCGDANATVDDVLVTLPKNYPVFAFLDPYVAELDWRTIEKLAAHKPMNKIELFILFAYNMGLVRLLPTDPTKLVNAAVLDRVMPDPEGWRRVYARRAQGQADPHAFRRAFLDEYVRGLKSLGYAFVPPPRLLFTPDKHPLYFMVFASDHPVGDRIMKWVFANEPDSTRQPSLLSYDQQY